MCKIQLVHAECYFVQLHLGWVWTFQTFEQWYITDCQPMWMSICRKQDVQAEMAFQAMQSYAVILDALWGMLALP